MRKYDSKAKKMVTLDWQQEFPSLKVFQNGRLLRRHGPLLLGLCFEGSPGNSEYVPICHFHCLCTPFPVISLSLNTCVLQSNGTPKRIGLSRHELDFKTVAQELKETCPYLMQTRLCFNDFIDATREYLSEKNGNHLLLQHNPYTDVILVAAHMGMIDYANEAICEFEKVLTTWPESAFNIIGSIEKWRTHVSDLVNHRDEIESNILDEIKMHKLETFTDMGFECSETPLQLLQEGE